MLAALSQHAWTIGPRLKHAMRPLAPPPSRPWATRLEDPVAGAVRITGRFSDVPGSEELLLLVHGLGGSTDSHYAVRAAHAVAAAGLACLRVNLRGSDKSGDDFYHAGLVADLHAALASPEVARFRRVYALGYSLGGHVALRLGADPGDPRVTAAAAVCSPVDLAAAADLIDRPARWLYRRYLLGNLVRIYAAVAAKSPRLAAVPAARAAAVRRIREWDDLIVAPRHGFADAADYYARESVAPRLPDLRVPALLLNSECDPMVPPSAVKPALAAAPLLTVRWVGTGGHCAFPAGLDVGLASEPGIEAQVLGWLRGQPPLMSS